MSNPYPNNGQWQGPGNAAGPWPQAQQGQTWPGHPQQHGGPSTGGQPYAPKQQYNGHQFTDNQPNSPHYGQQYGGPQSGQGGNPGQQPPSGGKPNPMLWIIIGVVVVALVIGGIVWGVNRKSEPATKATSAASSPVQASSGQRTPAAGQTAPSRDASKPAGRASTPAANESKRTGQQVDLGDGVSFNLPEGWQVIAQEANVATVGDIPSYLSFITVQDMSSVGDVKQLVNEMKDGISKEMPELKVVKDTASVDVGKGKAAAATLSGQLANMQQTQIVSAVKAPNGKGVLVIMTGSGSDANKNLESYWDAIFQDIAKTLIK